jgi:hypothetical protein
VHARASPHQNSQPKPGRAASDELGEIRWLGERGVKRKRCNITQAAVASPMLMMPNTIARARKRKGQVVSRDLRKQNSAEKNRRSAWTHMQERREQHTIRQPHHDDDIFREGESHAELDA